MDNESKTKKAKYDIEYAKNKLKRIPLDVSKEKYEEIKKAAQTASESVNGYIKEAIDTRLNNDKWQLCNKIYTWPYIKK